MARALEYWATVEAVGRACAIDKGCARVREIEEKAVTPAMRRIEADDPDRHLTGLDHCLKGKDRLAEKIESDVKKWGVFEVQFHTRASFEAKQQTHAAYEQLRTLPEDHEDIHRLRDCQREITAKVPVRRAVRARP